MNPSFALTRPLAVTRWHLVGEIAFPERRQWELDVLRHIADRGGFATPEEIDRDLLGGDRLRVAGRLMEILQGYALLDDRGVTLAVEQALERGSILVPRRGSWEILCSDDNLLPSPILSIDAVPEDHAGNDRRNGKSRDTKKPVRASNPRAPWFAASVLQKPEGRDVLIGDHRLARLDKEVSTLAVERVPLRDSLRLSYKDEVVALTLSFDGKDHPLQTPDFVPSHEEAWLSILDGKGIRSRWEPARSRLRVPFPEGREHACAAMKETYGFEEPMLPGVGGFDACEVGNVPICPEDRTEAKKWADWKLEHSLTDFAFEPVYEEFRRQVEEQFAEWGARCPDRESLLERVRRSTKDTNRALCWFLQAPIDWNL